ncbi:MAG: hypothetical protein KAR21_15490, partial [Spirochaetales bacterium]|nr:hypothetical protein [Spirochaetales bacterium]
MIKILSRKSSYCEVVSSFLNGDNYSYNARWYFRNSLINNPPETSNAHTSCVNHAYFRNSLINNPPETSNAYTS